MLQKTDKIHWQSHWKLHFSGRKNKQVLFQVLVGLNIVQNNAIDCGQGQEEEEI